MDVTVEYKTLLNMNTSTANFATWVVRVVDEPKLLQYSFKARGETVEAEKLECVFVSRDPAEYILGVVPFSFNDRRAAKVAKGRYVKGSVWEIKTPAFDPKAKKNI